MNLARLLAQEPDLLGVVGTVADAPSALADRLRARVGVNLDTQFGWREQYTALRNWTDAVEACGVLVSQFSDVEVIEARGFSLIDHFFPLVALNGKDAPRAKVFTLFHELAHISLGAAGVCDLHDSGDDGQSRVEIFCNQVAADFLVPSPALLNDLVVARHRGAEWGDDELLQLSTRFSVSQEVILRRLLTLGRTTLSFYRRKRDEYRQQQETLEGPAASCRTFAAYCGTMALPSHQWRWRRFTALLFLSGSVAPTRRRSSPASWRYCGCTVAGARIGVRH